MTEKIQDTAYFGQKGYTIPKKNLSLGEIDKIKNDLTVKAFLPNTLIKTEPFQFLEKNYVPLFMEEVLYSTNSIK